MNLDDTSPLRDFDFDRLSFDYEALSARLEAAEDWSKLVVAHIYLDHIVTATLRDHVPKADLYLNSGYKTFADKVAICQALNLIDGELAATLKSINRFRNKFAHRLVFDVPSEAKVELFKEFSPTRPVSDVLTGSGFSNFLFTVVMLLEFERVYSSIIADAQKAIVFHRGQMVELAKQMFSGEGFNASLRSV